MGGRVMGEVERQESIDTAPFRVNCSWCGDALTEPGALLFSPPDSCGKVRKAHVCVGCWEAYPLPHQPETLPRWSNDPLSDGIQRPDPQSPLVDSTGSTAEPGKFEGHTVYAPPGGFPPPTSKCAPAPWGCEDKHGVDPKDW